MSDNAAPASIVPKSTSLKTSRFKVPGEGASGTISVVTVVGLFVVWFAITNLGLIKPLFLPSPLSVWNTFIKLLNEGYQGKSLAYHLGISLFRFGLAFTLTVLVAVPLGLWMGMNETVKAVLVGDGAY